jgi:hypothetical protein
MNKLTRPYCGILGDGGGERGWILCVGNVGWLDLRWMRILKALTIHCVPSLFKLIERKFTLATSK